MVQRFLRLGLLVFGGWLITKVFKRAHPNHFSMKNRNATQDILQQRRFALINDFTLGTFLGLRPQLKKDEEWFLLNVCSENETKGHCRIARKAIENAIDCTISEIIPVKTLRCQIEEQKDGTMVTIYGKFDQKTEDPRTKEILETKVQKYLTESMELCVNRVKIQ